MRFFLTSIFCLSLSFFYAQSEFITTWKTDNPGSSASNRIVIPTYPGEYYDYTIDWGDGSIDSNVTESSVHTYEVAGTYQISISGQFPRIYFNDSGDKEKLILVNQWGTINWTSMEKAFSGCINLDVVASDTPNLSNVNDLSYIFNGCTTLVGTHSFSDWDTSNITNMRAVFMDTNTFNQDIGTWNTSEVVNMAELFKNSKAFNQDIGSWDTSKVTSLATTFEGATVFNQDIGNWNVSNVEVFLGTFAYTQNFNQDIGNWDVSSATDMSGMFSSALSFNQNIGSWDVSSVTRMINTFNFAISFNQNIGFWNVSNVTSMISMFYNAQNFNQNLAYWNVSNVENMSSMFDRAGNFNQNLGYWNISKVTNLKYMFSNAGLSTYNYDATLNGWAQLPSLHSNLTFDAGNSKYCFSDISRDKLSNDYLWIINDSGKNSNCQPENFITIWKTDNSGTSGNNQIMIPTYTGEIYDYTVDWGDGTSNTNVTGNITHTYYTPGVYQVSIKGTFPRIYFNETGDREKILEVKQWGDIEWTSIEFAFAGCSNLVIEALDTPDLSNVTSLMRMFKGCNYSFYHIETGNYSNFNGIENFNDWDVSNITNISGMFQDSEFNQDISSWNVSNVTDMSHLFRYSEFDQDISLWDVSNVTDMSYLFYISSFNHDVSSWNVSNVTNMRYLFSGLYYFNGEIGNWDVSSVENMNGMFMSTSNFNQDLSNWDVSSVTDMGSMFNSSKFDQDISSWDVSNVTQMSAMFHHSKFNKDISNWDITNVLYIFNIFDFSDLSIENYDKILLGWSHLPNLQNGLELGALQIQYCLGTEARDNLINTYNWTIVDQGENCEEARPFITTWKTDNPGPSEDNQITIPTNPREIYNYNVDWGDGTSDIGITEDITHTYDEPGTYQVTISGRFPYIFFNNPSAEFPFVEPRKFSDTEKIIYIDQWGTNRWSDMGFSFAGCKNLDVLATDVPNLTRNKSLRYMFYECSSLKGNESITQWNLRETVFLEGMFAGASQFNQPVGDWDISNYGFLYEMFKNAASFNQNLENWDFENVQNMEGMFDGSGISIANYDKLLKTLSSLPIVPNNVKLGAANTNFCNSMEARQELINTYGWEITDAGNDCSSTYFITTWKTDNPGVSEDNQITIPTFPGEIYDYTVDWGDGTMDTNITGDITHTYAEPGTYTVSISGNFPRIYFEGDFGNDSNGDFMVNDIDDNDKILSVDQWGSIEWKSMKAAFYGCSNLDVIAIDTPDLSKVQSMNEMFLFCTSLIGTPSFNNWDLNNVTSLVSLFFKAKKFNQDIGSWNTSNVTNMNGIFLMASSFNQNINGWDTSNVTNLATAFQEATSFNQPLNNWDVSSVRQFNSCFGSTNFNHPLDNWDTRSALEMTNMFADNPDFNQNINSWNVSSVTNFGGMFGNTASFNQPLNNWDVSAAEILGGMFFHATSFNQPLNNWDVSNVKEMTNMFAEAFKFNEDITSWDISSVTDTSGMFSGAEMFNQNIRMWDVAKVAKMNYMFAYASSFNQDLGGWNVSNVNTIELMFLGTGLSLENYDNTLSGWSNLPVLQNNVNFDAGSSQYCESEQARQFIIDTFGWTITDGGKVPFCNEDNDLDGILDHLDDCLDTRPNVMVNAEGCEIVASSAILVYGATPTCPGESNGSISISSTLTDYIFNIAVEGPVSTDYNEVSLNENLEVSNLTTGLYTVTISIPDISYAQTYGIQINEVGSISGKREGLNTATKTALYNVEGSYKYSVDVNGEMKTYNFTSNGKNEIQLSDLAEFNAISITGENDCQGMVTDSFAFSDDVIIFPTITTGDVFVEGFDELSTVLVYDLSGRLVFTQLLNGQNSNSIDLQALESGVYPTVIQSKEHSKTFKIIKR